MAEETKVGQVNRVAICIHAFSHVDFDVYMNHLFCVANWAKIPGLELVFIGKDGLDAANAREAIVERAREAKCTHGFFLDEDHFIPTVALPFLMERGNEAIVSGLVCKKGERLQQISWVYKVQPDGSKLFAEQEFPIDGRVQEVDVCAFGCTLINLEKLCKLKKPYFRDTCIPQLGVPINTRSDINLCLAFRDIGEHVYVDTRVLVGHKGIKVPVFPHNAKEMVAIRQLIDATVKLREGQQGMYYFPGDIS